MKADEYLEEVIKDAFERELDEGENIARTLPFFAASFAVAVPLYGYVTGRLPEFEFQLLSLTLHALLILGAGCAVMILWNLFLMVRLREYRILPKETEQIEWMQALRVHYEAQGLTAATVDKRVTQQLRDQMLLEYAAGAEHNREANAPKLRARASGVTFFVVMLVIAFGMIGIIFVSQRLPQQPRKDVVNVAAQTKADPAAEARRCATAATKTAGPAVGPEVSGCSGGQHGTGGEPQMTDGNKPRDEPSSPPAPAPAPARPAPPPASPQHQLLKKNEGVGARR